ncbi:MAG: flagellar filament capping protein FliD, partial [Selenomonadaceae bacterium]|nr:flagellar filament capping protein FliD [Selenomonadaceae bacterium]
MAVGGIYGLSGSGLDIDSMVKVGMMSKQNQLDKLQQTYTKNEWKKEAYLDIYDKINDFNLNKLTDYKLSGNMNARTATSSDSNLTAEANADASIGPHYIKVEQTATNAYLVGTKNNWDLPSTTTTTDPETGAETTTTTTTNYSLVKAGDKKLKDLGLSSGVSFTLNSETITVSADKTLYELVSTVNGKTSSTGVKMTYDNDNGYISFFQKNLGEANEINIGTSDTTTAKFLADLDLRDRGTEKDYTDSSSFITTTTGSGENTTTTGGIKAIGKDAKVNIDGKSITAAKNSVFSDGVTYNIGNVTADKDKTITVNVDQDKEKIVENVKSFVKGYNELLDSIYDAYRESPNSSYKPLTDAQKAEMTEDQIKKWEENATSGMRYHDQTLRKIIDDVRNAVTNTISDGGDYDSIYKIGISTTGLYGQLTLDETKLRDALTADSDAVYNVFGKNGT